MSLVLDNTEPAIVRGIKTVGVGKKGSKALTPELTWEILEDLKSGKVSPAAKGAFFAGLLAKGIEKHEEVLGSVFNPGALKNHAHLVEAIAADAPDFVRWVCVQLFSGHTLDKQTAYDLGVFLFSNQPGDGARGMVASFLRVRYETDNEYEGLLKALSETLNPNFTQTVPKGQPIIQLAEPFDGMDHSWMITPLIGSCVQEFGYRAVHMTGKNSGPKLVMNLLDIAGHLKMTSMKSSSDLMSSKPRFGWLCNQNDMSDAVERWNTIRRQTIKRPFMSTLERFVNPFKADILIASAFHPPYGEKMITIAERAGYKGVIIVRNGIEGSMAFPLLRPVKMLLSARQKDGSFKRNEISLDPPSVGIKVEQIVEKLTADVNARLIEQYALKGTSGDKHFDARIKATNAGLYLGIQWLKRSVYDLG